MTWPGAVAGLWERVQVTVRMAPGTQRVCQLLMDLAAPLGSCASASVCAPLLYGMAERRDRAPGEVSVGKVVEGARPASRVCVCAAARHVRDACGAPTECDAT